MWRASWNRVLISFSESPRHLLARELQRTLKKVVSNLEATALASIVLPVPGGPNNNRLFTELANIRVFFSEEKMFGKSRGSVTHS